LIIFLRFSCDEDGNAWATVEEFDSSVLNVQSGIDLALVAACRGIVSNHLLLNQSVKVGGISIAEAILATYPNVS
jgi:hypothetical protein